MNLQVQISRPTPVEKNGEVKIKNRIPTAYEKKSFRTWIKEGLLLGYDAEKGSLIVPSDHRSNSRRSVGVSDQTPLPNGTKKNPLPVPIVYRNPTSVGDLYQAAWHGSPYLFDRFTLDHIGSGVGAQWRGWGLYFTLDRGVAERYRHTTTTTRLSREDAQRYNQLTAYRDSLRGDLQQAMDPQSQTEIQRRIDEVDVVIRALAPDAGYVYQVEIPDDDVMVRSSSKVSDQPEIVQVAFQNLLPGEDLNNLTGLVAYRRLAKKLGSPRAASEALNGEGVQGLRYRNSTDGECAVVWNDEAISIRDFLQRSKDSGAALGSYSPTENRITLTPNANITTLSHEMGHFWLANAIEFSKSNRTDISLRQDMRKLFDIWGIKDQAYWDDLGVEGQRKYHEQFASWVEEYLSTGKVPAPTLQSLFEKFRTWITSLYRDMRAHLEGRYRSEFGEELPPLSKEVRDILDRNLAYEDAMRAARSDFSVTHAQADSARYANFERIKRQDQMTDQSDEQQTQASLSEEFKAADAINSGQKVEVSAPVDVDRMAGQKRIVEERLGFPETIAPKVQPEGMPVYETPQIQGLDQVPLELPSGSSPEEVAAAREGAEIVKESPNMAVVTADGESRTALQFMQETEQQAREVEAFSETLNKAAQCIVNNGGI